MTKHSLERTRGELSDFLKYHRRKIAPAEAGLPDTGRRRTAGLRREEVAALAGVGVTWYTWFEQGREIGVSEAFLLNVARALKLDDAECCHLFLLAHRRPPPPEVYQWSSIPPLVQQLMDDLAERPAYIINLRWDVVAWNAAADRLFDFAGKERQDRNFMRMVFASPELRRRLPAWEKEAPQLLRNFRCDLAVAPDDPGMLTLIEELQQLSPDFRRWWKMPGAGRYSRGIGSVFDRDGKCRRFQHEMLVVDKHRHLRMILYFAEDS